MAPRKPKADPFEELKSRGPRPVYLVDGEERVLVDEFVAAVRDAAVPQSARDFNVDVFSGRDAGLIRVLEAARTLPAFSPKRLVVCQHADKLDFEKSDAFLRYLEDPSPTSVLVFVADKLDARTKAYKAAVKAKATARFSHPKLQKMPDHVRNRARAMGVRIDARAVRALVDAVGTDVSAASQALEVLALYVGEPARPITADDVVQVVAVTREESVFALVDAIGLGDRVLAMGGLHAMLSISREHPLRILAMVARQYRNLLKARSALDAGATRAQIQALVGLPPFLMDGLLSQARRQTSRAFARGLEAVTATDRDLKGGALDGTRAMERLVLRLLGNPALR